MKRRRSTVLAVGWIAVLGSAIWIGQASGAANTNGVRNMKCAADDLVYSVISDFPIMVAGSNTEGAPTADEALERFLSKNYPKVKQDFKKVKNEGDKATYQKDKGDFATAEAQVENIAGAFEVSRFTACNTLLVEGDQ